jgi:hypothetical protein
MTIVVGLDMHREQITLDALDTETGEVRSGRVRPADRESFRRFLRRFEGEPVGAALEATTGWRFIVEELQAADATAHLAEPAETRSLRGRKRRAKVRLRKTLVDQRSAWQHRIQGAALPPRGSEGVAAADAGAPRAAHQSRAAGLRAQRNRDRAGADRPHQRAARPARGGAALVRPPPGGLPGPAGPLRHRRADQRRDPGRARRRPPLLLLASRRPLRRARRHRVAVRPVARPRQALPPGAAGPALRGLRGSPVRLARALARPPLLPRDQGPARWQAGRADDRPQTDRRAHHTLRELGDEALQPVPPT